MRGRPFTEAWRERLLRRWSYCLALWAIALGAFACNDNNDHIGAPGTQVDVLADDTAYSKHYETYAFRDVADLPDGALSGLSEGQQKDLAEVKDATEANLDDLGLRKVDESDADLLAFTLTRTAGEPVVDWTCVPGPWSGYWYFGAYTPCGWLKSDEVSTDSATIIVGLVDAERKEVVFVGFVRGLDTRASDRKMAIDEGIARVFDAYPDQAAGDAGIGADDAGADAAAAGAGDAGVDAGDAGTDAGDAAAGDAEASDGGEDAGDAEANAAGEADAGDARIGSLEIAYRAAQKSGRARRTARIST